MEKREKKKMGGGGRSFSLDWLVRERDPGVLESSRRGSLDVNICIARLPFAIHLPVPAA